jgi:hypothetical protein
MTQEERSIRLALFLDFETWLSSPSVLEAGLAASNR